MYGVAGIPDIIACVDGRFYAFEVKTDIGRTTKLQDATIRKILDAGGTAVVVRSVDEVRAVINGTRTTQSQENGRLKSVRNHLKNNGGNS